MMRKQRKTIRVVAAAILQEGRCLVTQRSPQMSNPLEWEFPGGKIEPGEDPRKALVREIREELSADIAVGEPLGSTTYRHDDRTIALEVYIATLLSGDIILTEHQGWGWFAGGEIDSLQWSLADRPLLAPLRDLLR